jgi:hypothetical protein
MQVRGQKSGVRGNTVQDGVFSSLEIRVLDGVLENMIFWSGL